MLGQQCRGNRTLQKEQGEESKSRIKVKIYDQGRDFKETRNKTVFTTKKVIRQRQNLGGAKEEKILQYRESSIERNKTHQQQEDR